jgi:hypothetical protein
LAGSVALTFSSFFCPSSSWPVFWIVLAFECGRVPPSIGDDEDSFFSAFLLLLSAAYVIKGHNLEFTNKVSF